MRNQMQASHFILFYLTKTEQQSSHNLLLLFFFIHDLCQMFVVVCKITLVDHKTSKINDDCYGSTDCFGGGGGCEGVRDSSEDRDRQSAVNWDWKMMMMVNWDWKRMMEADWGWERVTETESKMKGDILSLWPFQGKIVSKSTAYMLACFYGKMRWGEILQLWELKFVILQSTYSSQSLYNGVWVSYGLNQDKNKYCCCCCCCSTSWQW